jgi:hypothetical protein
MEHPETKLLARNQNCTAGIKIAWRGNLIVWLESRFLSEKSNFSSGIKTIRLESRLFSWEIKFTGGNQDYSPGI